MSAFARKAENAVFIPDSDGPKRLPNLLIIGAQKAGTTWLHWRLAKHPAILMSRNKELNFFGKRNYESQIEEYKSSFPVTSGKKFYGESTPGYFWTHDPDSHWRDSYPNGNHDIPSSVRDVLGQDTKLILSIRHPVDRAVSALFHHFRQGRTVPGDRLTTIGSRHGIIDIGFYARHWRNWANVFGEDAPIVIMFDRIASDPSGVMDTVLRRLGLGPGRPPSPEPDHVGFSMRVHAGELEIDPENESNIALAARRGCNIAAAPRVSEADIAILNATFREDIAFCQARWGDAAGVDWKTPRRLADLCAKDSLALP